MNRSTNGHEFGILGIISYIRAPHVFQISLSFTGEQNSPLLQAFVVKIILQHIYIYIYIYN